MKSIRRHHSSGFAAAVMFAACLASAATAGPAPTTPREELDLPYVAGGGHRQQLDLYLPAGRGFATILYVHEGSLTSGDRKDADYPRIARAFRDRGFAVAVMSYRLFPDARWPDPANDVASAFAWLRSNLSSRGGNPRRVFVLGHSSGAALAARLASDPAYLRRVGAAPGDIAGVVVMGTILRDSEFEAALARVPRARMDSAFARHPDFRPYRDVDSYLDSWPMRHVHGAMPPMLITVAEEERLQPPCLAHAEEFQALAARAGARVEVEVLPGRDHYSAMRKLPEPGDPTFARILRFFDSVGARAAQKR